MVRNRTAVIEHVIHTEDNIPVRQKPYRIPYLQRDSVRKEIDSMMEAGIIQPSVSAWASPIILVSKKDGGIRFCVDYRRLNAKSTFDAYPMPRIEELFEKIGPARVISTLDLAKGYWQIPLDRASQEKTAFCTPFGLYEFKVMPFGLHSAPATFQRLMNQVLRDCQSFAGAYIDDIVVYSGSWEEHLGHPKRVLRCLESAGLRVKLQKCSFGYSKVCYLGHVVGQGQIEPDGEKVAAVKNYPRPTTKRQVRAFLGLVGYYRQFLPKMAELAIPLTELLKKGQPEKVNWNLECDDTFRHAKEALVQAPVLRIANPTEMFVLQTDASNQGLGAVLSQYAEDGYEHPVAFASRKLLPREVNYAVVEKECLAIVWALCQFHVYLYGQEFTIETDHLPLSWLERMKNKNARLTRWSLQIQPTSLWLNTGRGEIMGMLIVCLEVVRMITRALDIVLRRGRCNEVYT